MIVNKNILENTTGVSPFDPGYGIFLWSSTEIDAGNAWAYSNQFGLDIYANGKEFNPPARAVKAF